MDFAEQTVMVTGGGAGIGRAVAEAFVRQGARVVIVDIRDDARLQELAAELSTPKAQCIAIRGDVGDFGQMEAIVDRIAADFKRLDVLVNNAGIIRRGSIESVTETDWDQVIRVNLKGTFNCCKAVAGRMISQRSGKIVNISSVAGKTGDITSAPGYASSKAAIDALTKTLARQLAPYGINVNGVAPHAIETEMSAEWPPEKRKAVIDAIPLKRLGRPEDVAEAVLFLASEKAAFITGEILDVNGGFLMD